MFSTLIIFAIVFSVLFDIDRKEKNFISACLHICVCIVGDNKDNFTVVECKEDYFIM